MCVYHSFRALKTTRRVINLFIPIKRTLVTEINVIKSKSPNVIVPNQLIHEYIWQNLHKWHEKTAITCFETERSYTYGELYEKTRFLSYNLRHKLRINKGDTVAIILPNIPEFPIAFLGAIEAGVLVTILDPFSTQDEMAYQLQNAGATIIFTILDLWSVIKKATDSLNKQLPIILVNTDKQQIPSGAIIFNELLKNHGTDNSRYGSNENVALLPYSSGTTGLNKGVELSHRNVVANLTQMSSPDFTISHPTEGNFQEVIPIFLPLFHIYGLVAVFLNYLSKGCKLITIPKFVPSQFVRLLKQHRPTLLFAVPQIIALILNSSRIKYEDMESIRTIISAAAPLGIAAVEKFKLKTHDRVNLLQIYGMTETSPLTLMQTTKLEYGMKIGGSGFLLPNTECKIVPIDGSLQGLGPNQRGELLIRGPQVMKGYHNNIKATREVFIDGWLRTGDGGYYDDNEHFFITDRLKEMIKVKGFQVAPAELEELLCHHDAVADAAVIGVPHRVQGEAPKAFVVLKKGYDTKPDLLKEFVAARVSGYKRLVGGVVIVDQIPRTPAGKILRRQLKNL